MLLKFLLNSFFSESLLYRLIFLVDNAIRLVKRESFFSFFCCISLILLFYNVKIKRRGTFSIICALSHFIPVSFPENPLSGIKNRISWLDCEPPGPTMWQKVGTKGSLIIHGIPGDQLVVNRPFPYSQYTTDWTGTNLQLIEANARSSFQMQFFHKPWLTAPWSLKAPPRLFCWQVFSDSQRRPQT